MTAKRIERKLGHFISAGTHKRRNLWNNWDRYLGVPVRLVVKKGPLVEVTAP